MTRPALRGGTRSTGGWVLAACVLVVCADASGKRWLTYSGRTGQPSA
jgi:hypothetical protein